MIYEMECNSCEKRSEIVCSLAEHETLVRPGLPCSCGGRYMQVFSSGNYVFGREPFPKNDPRWEHATDFGTPISCKSQLKDICEQNGNYSQYLENDM